MEDKEDGFVGDEQNWKTEMWTKPGRDLTNNGTVWLSRQAREVLEERVCSMNMWEEKDKNKQKQRRKANASLRRESVEKWLKRAVVEGGPLLSPAYNTTSRPQQQPTVEVMQMRTNMRRYQKHAELMSTSKS